MTPSLSILFISAALAGPFTAKSSQGSLPLAEVQRDLVLPKGWLALSLAHEHKASTQYRDAEGRLQDRSAMRFGRTIAPGCALNRAFSTHHTLCAYSHRIGQSDQ